MTEEMTYSNKTLKVFKIFVVTAMFAIYVALTMSKKTILVVQSYKTDYAWVRDIDTGMKRQVQQKGSFNINILYHYMDTKNYPGEAFKQKAGKIAKEVIEIIKPDVVIAVDDDASQYAVKNFINHKKMKIVFTGMNAKASIYGYDKANNVTGILERLPIVGIQEFLTILAPYLKVKKKLRAGHVADRSTVVTYDDQNMKESPLWSSVVLVDSLLAETFDEWKANILKSKNSMDVMLISNYRKVYRDNKKIEIVPIKEVMEWTVKNAPIPIIGINGFVAEEGAGIAIGTSPFEQGEKAMSMALDLASGRKAIKDLPIITAKQLITCINEENFEKQFLSKGWVLPTVYQSFASSIDRFFGKKGS